MSRLKVLFYGDDFTGSSENLAQFHRSGGRCKLYLAPPSHETIKADAEVFDVLGLAGTARALGPEDMRDELETAYASLSAVECDLVQYKICSTFDSAPSVGSFGIALDLARKHFGERAISVLAATPDFGRYTCFGNHFARFGETVVRLDRHPSMSTHPRTPMQEADLGRHLSAQTDFPFDEVHLPQLRAPGLLDRISYISESGCGVILDGANNEDLAAGVSALWQFSRQRPMFSLSAQGLAQHLGYLWTDLNMVPGPSAVKTSIPAVEQLLVLSGSCALQNGRQIDAAEAAGWAALHLDAERLQDERAALDVINWIAPKMMAALQAGRSVVIYTAKGTSGRLQGSEVPAPRLGAVFAELMRRARVELRLPRVVLAGGDSSSFAIRHSGAKSLEIAVFDSVQNSHVCSLATPDAGSVDGLEVMLKGGQVGRDDFFLRAQVGTEAITTNDRRRA